MSEKLTEPPRRRAPCPTCQHDSEWESTFGTFCLTCGRLCTGGVGFVPAQAKEYAALRRALQAVVTAFTADAKWHQMEWAVDQARAALEEVSC